MNAKTYNKNIFISLLILIPIVAFGYLMMTNVFGDTTVGVTIQTNPDLDDGLVGHWTFDGDTFDRSSSTAEFQDLGPNNYDGDWILHSTTTVPGILGQAIELSGEGTDYDTVNILDGWSHFTDDFSIAFWFKSGSDTLSSTRRIITTYDGFGTDFVSVDISHSGEDLSFRYESGNQLQAINVPGINEGWHHVVATREGTRRQIFYDGINIEGDDGWPAGTYTLTSNDFLRLGGQPSGSNGSFDGLLDDVRIYDRALGTSTVQRIYELGATTKIGKTIATNPDLQDGLVLHYTFDASDIDISASTAEIRDRSSEQEHGDWQDHATTTVPGVLGQAIEINGGNDDIIVADGYTTHFAEDFTIATWFYVRDIPSGDSGLWTTYGGVGGTRMYGDLDTGEYVKVSMDVGNNSFTTTGDDAIPVGYTIPGFRNTWHHMAFVRDNSGDAYIYIDGVQRAATTTFNPGTFTLTGNDLLQIADGRNARHDGYLDDFRIYNRTLEASSIKRLYELGATTRIGKTVNALASLNKGLIAHWSFDGATVDRSANTGEILDASGNFATAGDWENHATTTVPGKIGQAIYFDGVDDAIEWSDGPFVQMEEDGLSAFAWFKVEGSTGAQQAIYDRFVYSPRMNLNTSGDGIRCFLQSDEPAPYETSYVDITIGEWYHAGCVFSTTTKALTLYINGASSTSADATGFTQLFSHDTQAFNVGEGYNDNENFYGLIDDVRLWNRNLTPFEIERLYQLGN